MMDSRGLRASLPMLGLSFGELLLLAFIGILFLKPAELRRMAHTAGRWMADIQRMSREFTRELVREADLQDIRDEARKLKHEVKGLLSPDEAAAPVRPALASLADEKPIRTDGEREQAEDNGYQPAFPETAAEPLIVSPAAPAEPLTASAPNLAAPPKGEALKPDAPAA